MPKIGYHIVIDDISNGDLDKLLLHIMRYKPEYVNVKGGERFDKAMQFVERMSYNAPDTKVILRKWPDDGILARYNYDAYSWFEHEIYPLLNWLKRYKPLWLLDNESMSDDLKPYAQASYTAMELMANHDLNLAVGRFATGNPKEHQYQQLDKMWEGLKKWYDLHIFSPNEYFEKPDKISGSGSIFRYHLAWNRCKEQYNFYPRTVIGEFGLAVGYDPHKGFRKINLDENVYGDLCNFYFSRYYAPYEVPVCMFSVGVWNGFEIGESFRTYLENNPVIVKTIEKPGIFEQTETPKPIEDKPSEDNTEMETLLDLLRSIVTNRKYMIPLIGGLIAFLINQFPELGINPEVWTERIFQLILVIVGGDVAFDISNVIKENVWNKKDRKWE